MSRFKVNNQVVESTKNISLLRFLRDEMHLTSVKDGCSEGACGACMVLIDGINTKSCTVTTDMLNNKSVITVDGLSTKEKDIYSYAFGKMGAVQCGFCTPGMVISAKALLDKNLDPTEDEIKEALKYNLCRCTGYKKIIEAVRYAASLFKGEEKEAEPEWKIGASVIRSDAKDKTLGTGIYPDDIYLEGMTHAVALRSKYPRAIVNKIDTSLALKEEGVIRVLTAKDVTGNKTVGHIIKDWDAFIAEGETTHFLGDVIALVVAETREEAERATRLIKVDYTPLEAVDSPISAKRDGAPLVHPEYPGNIAQERHIARGNAVEAIKNSDYTYTETFHTPWTEHAFLEPECAVSVPTDDGVKIYSTDQGVYDTLHETAPFLGLPMEKVKVENCLVGGGFGGKEDVTVQHLSALCALLTGRPCKMKLSREESILFHPKRHPMDITITIGVNNFGDIMGVKALVVADTGAYQSLCGPVLERACTHASGPYHYENFQIDGYAYYTNNPPAGAFRGFGVTQTCFAIETALNRVAEMVGISGWEIRMRNAIRPGETLPNGQIVDNSTGLVETLKAVESEYKNNKIVGISSAMKNAGVGVGLPDWGRVRLKIENGMVVVHSAGSCIGQGLWTVLKQIVCTTTGLSGDKVKVSKASTSDPDSGTTSGSRHTTITGEAARRASLLLKEVLETKTLEEIEGEEYYAEYLAKTDKLGSPLPNPKSHVAYGYATQICIIDENTGKIKKIVASHDVGKAINPLSLEGQIEGGVVMSLGYALRERYRLDNCKPLDKYGSLGLFRADEIPLIEPIIIEKKGLDVSYGAIGIGEITSIPTSPAILDAYYHYDGKIRNSLPLENTPYSIKKAEKKILKKGKRLFVNPSSSCIGCLECVRSCSLSYEKVKDPLLSRLRIERKDNTFKPKVCLQCGLCAKACPENAITVNNSGVYMINKTKCIKCGKCQEACPVGVITITENSAIKCISCGLCVSSCPMDVLQIAKES